MEVTLYILVILLTCSNIFWALQYHKLADRFMSRNFGDYVVGTRAPTKPKLVLEDMADPLAERHAEAANQMLGII